MEQTSCSHELRPRTPQTGNTVSPETKYEPEGESDDESESESPESDAESEDGDDEDMEDAPQSEDPEPARTSLGLITLLPSTANTEATEPSTISPTSESETVADPVPTVAPPESIVDSISVPATLISSTVASEPSVPAEEGTQVQIPTTAARFSETADSTIIPSGDGDAEQVENTGSRDENVRRGADAGIILGTLGMTRSFPRRE